MTDSEESFPVKEEKQNGLERVLECFPEMSWYHFGKGARIFLKLGIIPKIDEVFYDFKIPQKSFFEIYLSLSKVLAVHQSFR